MTYADDLKARIITSLLPSLDVAEVIGVEVRFGDGKFRADLVIASEDRLSAIEIKGPRDNLDRLAEQAAGYTSLFLEFTVAVAPAYVDAVRAIVTRETGILLVTPERVQWIRRPNRRTRLSKASAFQWLRTQDLREILRTKGLSVGGTYEDLVKRTADHLGTDELSRLALASVKARLASRYEAFVGELGRTVTLDDVKLLTLADRITSSGE
jgi:hypothetical protein